MQKVKKRARMTRLESLDPVVPEAQETPGVLSARTPPLISYKGHLSWDCVPGGPKGLNTPH